MNKLYQNQSKNLHRVLQIVLILFLSVQWLSAQTQLNWTGLISSDALVPDNWSPSGGIAGNILIVDSAVKFTNQPVIGGTGDITINNLTLRPTSILGISRTNSADRIINSTETPTLSGIINIDNGILRIRRCEIRLKSAVVNVTGTGTLECIKYLFFGGSATPTEGGYINISGNGVVRKTREQDQGAPGRFPADTANGGVITIIENGKLEFLGQWSATDLNILIERGNIVTTPDRDIVWKYDAVQGITTVFSRSKMAFVVEPEASQKIVANSPGNIIRVVKNAGHASMVSFTWKYGTTSGGPYDQVIAGQTGDTIVPTFPVQDSYYLVCVGNNGTVDVVSNEVSFLVSSDKVLINPSAKQKIKQDELGYTLTVTETETATSREWKYTTTSGSNYLSFSTLQTGTELIPQFDAPGKYYVICESTIGGVVNYSAEVEIEVVIPATGYEIIWNGSISYDAKEMRNWTPISHIFKNILVVPVDTPNEPILSDTGNDTINRFDIKPGATFTMSKPATDSLYVSTNQYIDGELIVESGYIFFNDYLRFATNVSTLTQTGGEIVTKNDILLGPADVSIIGGKINLSGNAILRSLTTTRRFATDSLNSVITITDDAKLLNRNDWTADANTRIIRNQIKTAEGRELVITYPYTYQDSTVTLVYSKDLAVFNIIPETKQVIGVNKPGAKLTPINDDAIASYEWKYTTTSGSGYTSFTPAQTGDTLVPVFASAGNYFVICEGNDGVNVIKSSEVNVLVVSVTITPDAVQDIIVNADGTLLTVTESATASSREWLWSATQGSGYSSFAPQKEEEATYLPNFSAEGTYYVICQSMVEGSLIQSNEVTINVSPISSVENNNLSSIILYPNPSKGEVLINPAGIINFRIEIIDIQGKTVFSQKFENVSELQRIHLDEKGLYIVKLITDDHVKLTRLVIE